MTGWIKMGTGLASHGKVKALRRALKADRLRVVGGLWAVWCVFDEHSAGGKLAGYTLDDMDEEIGWRGFSAAMQDIGWLVQTDDGLEAPDYEDHNGPNAKRRALDASRKGSARKVLKESADGQQNVGEISGRMSASDADSMRNREEKRREEERNTPIPPEGAVTGIDPGKDSGSLPDIAPRKPKDSAVGLKAWLEAVKAKGEKPIPAGDAVLAYAAEVGIPDDFLTLAWAEFRHRYCQPDAKRYRDWRSVFRKAVRGNWLKLWFVGADGAYGLTTVGRQAQRANDERRAA
ncbi:MAG: hypothetical protein ACRC2G_15250 [Aestuariivirga sp.]